MKKRVLYISVALWVLAIIITAFVRIDGWKDERKIASYSDGYEVGDTVYLTEHLKDGSVLYTMDKNGRVSDVFLSNAYEKGSLLGQISYSEKLYGVLEKTVPGVNSTEKRYRIVRFDRSGNVDAKSPLIKCEQPGDLTGFWADDSGFYLTTVIDGGNAAGVYHLESETVVPLSQQTADEAGNVIEPADIEMSLAQLEQAGGIRRIAAAEYKNGETFIWKDNGQGNEYFIHNPQWDELFNSKDTTLMQFIKLNINSFINYLILLVAGILVIVIVNRLLKGRSHTFYTIMAMEAVLAVTALTGAVLIPYMQMQNRAEESRRFGNYYLQEAMNTIENEYLYVFDDDSYSVETEYKDTCDRLSSLTETDYELLKFEDVCLVRSSDGMIMASASGRSGTAVENVYTGQAALFVNNLQNGSGDAVSEVCYSGKTLKIIGVGMSDKLSSDYVLIGMAKDEKLREAYKDSLMESLLTALLLFLVASVVVIWIQIKRGKELEELARAMKAVAGGEKEIGEKTSRSKDIDGMWNSLFETEKSITRSNYDKYKVFESCYRFAPKNIETILGKESIIEVKGGDVADINGTVAIIGTQDSDNVTDIAGRINEYINVLEKHRDERKGLFVSGHSSLSRLKVLFLKEITDTVQFGVSMLHEMSCFESVKEMKPGVFLHYAEYVYGIAGTESQCFPFLISKDLRQMENFADWFRRMDTNMVITETVKNREFDCGELRYIGYINLDSGEKLKLYECLDAYSVQEKYKKHKTMDRFNEALKLLYHHDFYFARNAFSEVLKENPRDKIAKWYLFTCEKYLNEINPENDVCALQIDERFSQNN